MDSVLLQYPCLSGVQVRMSPCLSGVPLNTCVFKLQTEHVTTYMGFGEGRRVERSTTPGFSHVLLSSLVGGRERLGPKNKTRTRFLKFLKSPTGVI